MKKIAQCCLALVISGFTVTVLGGCAFGTTRVRIDHDYLAKSKIDRKGTILVRQLVDRRGDKHQGPYIGTKRNGYGMACGYIGTLEGVTMEKVLTESFAETLRSAGYRVVMKKEDVQDNYDAILEGTINEFWMDLYMAVWHQVDVSFCIVDPTTGNIRWNGRVKGSKTNILWLGITPEYEAVISQALTIAMEHAVTEFSSDKFQQSVVGP